MGNESYSTLQLDSGIQGKCLASMGHAGYAKVERIQTQVTTGVNLSYVTYGKDDN